MRYYLVLAACASFALALGACGGSSGDVQPTSDAPVEQNEPEMPPPAPLPPADVTLVSDGSLDGRLSLVPPIAYKYGLIWVGDDQYRSPFEGYLMFPLAGLPDASEIDSAFVVLYQVDTLGDPYGILGRVMVDRVDMGEGLRHSFVDYPLLEADVGVLSTDATKGVKTLDITEVLRAARTEGAARLDLRLRCEKGTNRDVWPDQARFNGGEDDAGIGQPARIHVKLR